MQSTVKLSDQVFWLGLNDRRTTLFENLWPLDRGVAYNSYLIRDTKNVLIDTVEKSKADDFLAQLAQLIPDDEKIDYLVINHMEPDHSGAITDIVRLYPDVTIVGNKTTFNLLRNFYGITENKLEVKQGDELDIGSRKLKFVITPWVHWPETMMTVDQKDEILFAGDAFGSFGALEGGVFDDELNIDYYEDEMRRYYSNIVGKYSKMTQKALKKVSAESFKMIAPTHGPIWRTDLQRVLSLYEKWSIHEGEDGVVIVFGSMYGNTEKMADLIGRKLAQRGIKNVRIYDASKTHVSYILSDIWKYKGLILGSCAYNATMFPPMECLTNKLINLEVKNKVLGIFGSSSWNGAGVKELNKFAETIQWELLPGSAEAKGAANEESFTEAEKLAYSMANALGL